MTITSIRCLCCVSAVVATLAASPVVNGQRNFDGVEITTTKLGDNLYSCRAREDRSVCWPDPTVS